MRLLAVAGVAGLIAVLAGPAAYALTPLGHTIEGGNPLAGPTAGGGVGGSGFGPARVRAARPRPALTAPQAALPADMAVSAPGGLPPVAEPAPGTDAGGRGRVRRDDGQ